MKPRLAVLALLAAVLFFSPLACRKKVQGFATGYDARSSGVAGVADRPAGALRTSSVEGFVSGKQASPAAPPGAGPAPTDPADPSAGQKRIRNGEISIEVGDFAAAARSAARIAGASGGYVSDTQAGGEEAHRHGTLTIRVRAASFETALEALKALGKVQSEHVATQDITKAYTDLEARLRVKRDAAERIREILKNRTARLSDVLEAEKQLTELVEQIEVMEGERRFYDQQVALSTISAELHEPEALTRPSALMPLRQAIRDSVYNLSTSMATFLTGMLFVLPWALAIVFLIWLARRIRRRSRKA